MQKQKIKRPNNIVTEPTAATVTPAICGLVSAGFATAAAAVGLATAVEVEERFVVADLGWPEVVVEVEDANEEVVEAERLVEIFDDILADFVVALVVLVEGRCVVVETVAEKLLRGLDEVLWSPGAIVAVRVTLRIVCVGALAPAMPWQIP